MLEGNRKRTVTHECKGYGHFICMCADTVENRARASTNFDMVPSVVFLLIRFGVGERVQERVPKSR